MIKVTGHSWPLKKERSITLQVAPSKIAPHSVLRTGQAVDKMHTEPRFLGGFSTCRRRQVLRRLLCLGLLDLLLLGLLDLLLHGSSWCHAGTCLQVVDGSRAAARVSCFWETLGTAHRDTPSDNFAPQRRPYSGAGSTSTFAFPTRRHHLFPGLSSSSNGPAVVKAQREVLSAILTRTNAPAPLFTEPLRTAKGFVLPRLGDGACSNLHRWALPDVVRWSWGTMRIHSQGQGEVWPVGTSKSLETSIIDASLNVHGGWNMVGTARRLAPQVGGCRSFGDSDLLPVLPTCPRQAHLWS